MKVKNNTHSAPTQCHTHQPWKSANGYFDVPRPSTYHHKLRRKNSGVMSVFVLGCARNIGDRRCLSVSNGPIMEHGQRNTSPLGY